MDTLFSNGARAARDAGNMEPERLVLLVRASQAGDRAAFGELAAHFEPTVFAVALRRLRNRSEAAEVTQDVLMRAMRKIGQLEEPERFAGWLKQVAVRMSINRAVRRPKEAVCAPETFGGEATGGETALDSLLRGEAAALVRGSLDRLKELDRRTLTAFYFEGRSLKEIGEEFACPVGTVKRRLHTARGRLKAELASVMSA
ncbi:RNA polymerase sigma factor [Alienimonas californiensis]|uniref:ECF RNA polymerase sigma factor SigW n=1 Tax=Alienimonas californiensis TaxID=2527989 RepID=A0A517P9R7_9PLAN|nr:sigma-70 family RNA polymerase sigma factor [Alienimonas californiensis]QDT16126.1 ECF RNA polymerase sigma factor SigW [Alienimonas californiensis]